MRATVLIVFVLACFAFAKTKWNQLDDYTFEQYKGEFHKRYATKYEEQTRRSIFEEKMQKIRTHNRNPASSWKMGVNYMTDFTQEECMAMVMKTRPNRVHPVEFVTAQFNHADISSLPKEVDWRKKGVVTAVKNQGGCGSCWTFGSTETIESQWAIQKGKLEVLSEQQILDCTPNPDDCGGTGGCGGGTPELAYAQIIKMGGITTEAAYPYQDSSYGQCEFNRSMPIGAKIKGYKVLPSNKYAPVMEAIATVGPLAINVDASSWFGYDSGVMTCDMSSPDIDHVVQLVGYGTDPQQGDYWLVRNSWGEDWGENGYIRLFRNPNPPCGNDTSPGDGTGCNGGPSSVTVCGDCGLLYDVSYPTL